MPDTAHAAMAAADIPLKAGQPLHGTPTSAYVPVKQRLFLRVEQVQREFGLANLSLFQRHR